MSHRIRGGCVFGAVPHTRDSERVNFSCAEIENDVADLIAQKLIEARIDHRAGLVISKTRNKRRDAILEAVKTQETFIWKTQSILLRNALASNQLVAGAATTSRDDESENMFE